MLQVLIISDVHGNLPALEYVLGLERNCDLIVSLGDVVNYGPWSNECVDLLEAQKNIMLIKGNHEEAFMKGSYDATSEITRAFFDTCYPQFNRLEKISSYSAELSYSDFDLKHTIDDRYIFPDTDVEINRNTFIGHSHRMFSKMINNYRLVNAGSVGQNRSNVNHLNYVLWNPEKETIEMVTKDFSADPLINEMISRGYPEICINYYKAKQF